MFWCQALAAWAGNHGMLISFQEIQCFDRVNDLQFLHHVKLWRRISFLKGNAFPVAAVHSEAKTKNWVSQVPSARQKWKYNLWIKTGWRFGTFFIFPYIGKNHPNWLIFFRGVETTNQKNWWAYSKPHWILLDDLKGLQMKGPCKLALSSRHCDRFYDTGPAYV
jgi:hypothetical protein